MSAYGLSERAMKQRVYFDRRSYHQCIAASAFVTNITYPHEVTPATADEACSPPCEKRSVELRYASGIIPRDMLLYLKRLFEEPHPNEPQPYRHVVYVIDRWSFIGEIIGELVHQTNASIRASWSWFAPPPVGKTEVGYDRDVAEAEYAQVSIYLPPKPPRSPSVSSRPGGKFHLSAARALSMSAWGRGRTGDQCKTLIPHRPKGILWL